MPPPARCARDQPAEGRLGGCVERRVGSSSSHSGRRATSSRASADPPPWPGRQRTGAADRRAGEADLVERRTEVSAGPPRALPEAEVLGEGQRRLQRVEMAEIVAYAADRRASGAGSSTHRAGGGREQPGEDAQQRRLAGTVRPGDRQQLAGRECEVEVREHRRGRRAGRKAVAAGACRGDLAACRARLSSSLRGMPGERCKSASARPLHRLCLEPVHEIHYKACQPAPSASRIPSGGPHSCRPRGRISARSSMRDQRRSTASRSRKTLTVGDATYDYFSLAEAEKNGLAGISRLPFSLKVLLENLLRYEDGRTVTADDIAAIAAWLTTPQDRPRDRLPPGARADAGLHRRAGGGRPRRDARRHGRRSAAIREKINPLVPVDLVIDHSVIVDEFGNAARLRRERRARIRAQRRALPLPALGPVGLRQFPRRAAGHRHLPPGQPRIPRADGLDATRTAGDAVAYPDTLVGTDSHTTMVNGLAVLGWGVGGIEAEAAMLGQPISMLIPEVVGFQLTGKLPRGRHRHRPRAHRHADAAQEGRGRQVRRVLRRRASTTCRSPTARPSPTWRPNMAPPAASSRSTSETLALSATTGRDDGADRAGRGLCQGAGHVARRRHADPVSPTARPRPRHGRAVARRPEAAAGPRAS